MKVITASERMALIGLLTVGDDLNKQLYQVEKAMYKITGEDTAELGAGHCSDMLYGGDTTTDKFADADRLIRKLKLEVIPDHETNDSGK